jgi:hypothetical protein
LALRHFPYFLFTLRFLMSRRQNLIMEASLSPPPSLEAFVLAIQTLATTVKGEGEPDPLNGPLFDTLPDKKKDSGTVACEKAAVKHFLNFVTFCNAQNVTYPSLDEFFRAWGRRCIVSSSQFDKKEDIAKCDAKRDSQGVGPKIQVADTWRTYINALTRAY